MEPAVILSSAVATKAHAKDPNEHDADIAAMKIFRTASCGGAASFGGFAHSAGTALRKNSYDAGFEFSRSNR